MKKAYFWLSYDLGLKGDYQGLYTWLDNHKAKECGDSFAFIQDYPYKENLTQEVKLDLEKNVEFKKSDRIYIIREAKPNFFQGIFIKGGRKNESPWNGYGSSDKLVTDDGPI